MSIFKKKSKPVTEERGIVNEWNNPVTGKINFNPYNTFNQSSSLKLSAVYRCVSLISDSIGSLPFNPYIYKGNWPTIDDTNTIYNLLNIQANSFMGSFMFKKLVAVNMLMKGNFYAVIDRANNGTVLSLTALNPDYVQIYVNGNLITDVTDFTSLGTDINITYRYLLTGKEYDKSQIIHVPNYVSANGLLGISTLDYAIDTLGLASYTNEHSSNFFKGGANLAGILRPKEGKMINSAQATKAKQDFISALSPVVGGVSGGIVALESGMEYQAITVSPQQSQMIENKTFSVMEICRYFGVPPSLAFSETQKYSTAEQQAIDFLNNGLLPLIEKIENEFYRKLYLPSEWAYTDLKFNVENFARLDAVTKADVLTKLISAGVKTPNEGREMYNAKFPLTGGNNGWISTNLQDMANPVVKDNKLKQDKQQTL
jgi:HK97 family phage portal protein